MKAKYVTSGLVVLAATMLHAHAMAKSGHQCVSVTPKQAVVDEDIDIIIHGRVFEREKVPYKYVDSGNAYPNRIDYTYKILVEHSWKGPDLEGKMITVNAVVAGPLIPEKLEQNEQGYFMALRQYPDEEAYTFSLCEKVLPYDPEYGWMVGFGRESVHNKDHLKPKESRQ